MASQSTRKRKGPYKKRKYENEEMIELEDVVVVEHEILQPTLQTLVHQDTNDVCLDNSFVGDASLHEPCIDTLDSSIIENSPPTSPFEEAENDHREVYRCEIPYQNCEPNTIPLFDAEQLAAANSNSIDPELDEVYQSLFECPEEVQFETLFGDDSDVEIQDLEDDILVFNDIKNDPDAEPLYPGATVTVGALMLLLAVFCTKHNLTGDAIQQLLNIFALVIPNNNNLCTSLSAFKKFFLNLKNPLVKHYYCCHCLGYIKDEALKQCPYAKCGKKLDENKEYFLEIPVESQLKSFFSQTGFFTKLQERFKTSKKEKSYEDIYDGYLYRSYCENSGPLSSSENISFTLNTDGAAVFKSSKMSVWPIFLVINELPYRLRMQKENMILAGLWFGNQKPSMGTYLQPFIQTFQRLDSGIQVTSPENGTFTCRAYLLCATADLPARCLLCNGIQFNGAFSCWKCKQPGETAKVGKGHCHVFPFKENSPNGPKRTHTSVVADALKALNKQESGEKLFTADGVKGPSWLTLFPKFNIVDGIAIDYMHGILLGIQKLLLTLWFSASHKGKTYNYHNNVIDADKRLLQIQPTLDITRLPRSIEHDIKYWKASEYRSFLLFFGATVLNGIISRQRFAHYLLLVEALHILLRWGSSEKDIETAEQMLFNFCRHFAALYDKCYMTLNIHQLVHLADSVRCLGPLYTHSCFFFEDKNGILMKMIRGTQNIDNQIVTGVSFLQKMPELKAKNVANGSEIEKLYNSIEFPNILKRGQKITDETYVLGAIKQKTLTVAEQFALNDYLKYAPVLTTYCSFKRLELNGFIVYGLEYSRMFKRDNSTVCFKTEASDSFRFGRVRFFLMGLNENEEDQSAYAMLEDLECPHFTNGRILVVKKTNNLRVVPINGIIESCMFISCSESPDSYVCRFPNKLESD